MKQTFKCCQEPSLLTLVLTILLCTVPSAKGCSQVYHYTETGLPVCYIETDDSLAVITKEEYIPAVLRIEQDGNTLLDSRDISIRLRGNSTIWYEKKPYKVKFSKKTAPFPGMSRSDTGTDTVTKYDMNLSSVTFREI